MYGTQASALISVITTAFENDVKMYGTQALFIATFALSMFENDVKMYGTQALSRIFSADASV